MSVLSPGGGDGEEEEETGDEEVHMSWLSLGLGHDLTTPPDSAVPAFIRSEVEVITPHSSLLTLDNSQHWIYCSHQFLSSITSFHFREA